MVWLEHELTFEVMITRVYDAPWRETSTFYRRAIEEELCV